MHASSILCATLNSCYISAELSCCLSLSVADTVREHAYKTKEVHDRLLEQAQSHALPAKLLALMICNGVCASPQTFQPCLWLPPAIACPLLVCTCRIQLTGDQYGWCCAASFAAFLFCCCL